MHTRNRQGADHPIIVGHSANKPKEMGLGMFKSA